MQVPLYFIKRPQVDRKEQVLSFQEPFTYAIPGFTQSQTNTYVKHTFVHDILQTSWVMSKLIVFLIDCMLHAFLLYTLILI